MNVAEMRRRLASARVAHLATASPEGMPHVVPVCFAFIEDRAYTAVDHKPKRSTRLRRIVNIEANPPACLLVDEYRDEDWTRLWWVRADGRGRTVDDPDEARAALAALGAKYRQYAERPPSGPVIAVDVARLSGWSAA